VAQNVKEPEVRPIDGSEAYEVYAAALALEHPAGELLIAETTVPFQNCLEPGPDNVVRAAIKNYRKTNQSVWHLQSTFSFGRDYRLLSAKEISDLRQPDPMGGFFWHFPDGTSITHLSAIGFDAAKTVAFVEIDSQCGGACGSGRPHVLQKRDGKWQRYESNEKPKIIKRQKDKNGGYVVAYRSMGTSYCSWSY
jgi:hypothetical protein